MGRRSKIAGFRYTNSQMSDSNLVTDLECDTKMLAESILARHAREKRTQPLRYSLRFIDAQTFESAAVADFLARDVSDSSFDPLLTTLSSILNRLSTRPVTVLNVGSGEGVLTRLVQSRFEIERMIDLDLSAEMLLRSNADERVLGDVLDLPLPDASVDVVISHCTIRYLAPDQHLRFVRQSLRVLKAGGSAIVTETNPQVAECFYHALRDVGWRSVASDDQVRMFRCSRFYCLYGQYLIDSEFRSKVDADARTGESSSVRLLGALAGYKIGSVKTMQFGALPPGGHFSHRSSG